jgi:hypothetical protein
MLDKDPLADIPPLNFEHAQSDKDRVEALKLVTNTITQQRSVASKALIYNPFTFGIWALLCGILYPFVVKKEGDLPIMLTSSVGLIMAVLAGIRFIVKPYEDLAEKINWDWLGNDEIIVARFGDNIIGTCVYRIEGGVTGKKKSQNNSTSKRLLIRCWTTRRRERERGIGQGLLEKVVDIAKENGCDSVEFAPKEIRAGAERVLNNWNGIGGFVNFNAEFDKNEDRAEAFLRRILKERIPDKRRRGSR